MFNNFSSENRAAYETRWKKAQNALFRFHCKNGYANVDYLVDSVTMESK
jgi:hypothetical protein